MDIRFFVFLALASVPFTAYLTHVFWWVFLLKSLQQARTIIKRGLITEHLRKAVKGFRRVRTCQVTDFGQSDQKADNSELDRLMVRATELNCVPENIDNYKRPDFKQKALEKAIDAADCPDGPRYKALGNSMAVPVMRWIGERIDMVEGRL